MKLSNKLQEYLATLSLSTKNLGVIRAGSLESVGDNEQQQELCTFLPQDKDINVKALLDAAKDFLQKHRGSPLHSIIAVDFLLASASFEEEISQQLIDYKKKIFDSIFALNDLLEASHYATRGSRRSQDQESNCEKFLKKAILEKNQRIFSLALIYCLSSMRDVAFTKLVNDFEPRSITLQTIEEGLYGVSYEEDKRVVVAEIRASLAALTTLECYRIAISHQTNALLFDPDLHAAKNFKFVIEIDALLQNDVAKELLGLRVEKNLIPLNTPDYQEKDRDPAESVMQAITEANQKIYQPKSLGAHWGIFLTNLVTSDLSPAALMTQTLIEFAAEKYDFKPLNDWRKALGNYVADKFQILSEKEKENAQHELNAIQAWLEPQRDSVNGETKESPLFKSLDSVSSESIALRAQQNLQCIEKAKEILAKQATFEETQNALIILLSTKHHFEDDEVGILLALKEEKQGIWKAACDLLLEIKEFQKDYIQKNNGKVSTIFEQNILQPEDQHILEPEDIVSNIFEEINKGWKILLGDEAGPLDNTVTPVFVPTGKEKEKAEALNTRVKEQVQRLSMKPCSDAALLKTSQAVTPVNKALSFSATPKKLSRGILTPGTTASTGSTLPAAKNFSELYEDFNRYFSLETSNREKVKILQNIVKEVLNIAKGDDNFKIHAPDAKAILSAWQEKPTAFIEDVYTHLFTFLQATIFASSSDGRVTSAMRQYCSNAIDILKQLKKLSIEHPCFSALYQDMLKNRRYSEFSALEMLTQPNLLQAFRLEETVVNSSQVLNSTEREQLRNLSFKWTAFYRNGNGEANSRFIEQRRHYEMQCLFVLEEILTDLSRELSIEEQWLVIEAIKNYEKVSTETPFANAIKLLARLDYTDPTLELKKRQEKICSRLQNRLIASLRNPPVALTNWQIVLKEKIFLYLLSRETVKANLPATTTSSSAVWSQLFDQLVIERQGQINSPLTKDYIKIILSKFDAKCAQSNNAHSRDKYEALFDKALEDMDALFATKDHRRTYSSSWFSPSSRVNLSPVGFENFMEDIKPKDNLPPMAFDRYCAYKFSSKKELLPHEADFIIQHVRYLYDRNGAFIDSLTSKEETVHSLIFKEWDKQLRIIEKDSKKLTQEAVNYHTSLVRRQNSTDLLSFKVEGDRKKIPGRILKLHFTLNENAKSPSLIRK